MKAVVDNRLHVMIKKEHVESLCDILNEISEINASSYFELMSNKNTTVSLRMLRVMIDEDIPSTTNAYIGLYIIINKDEKNMTCILNDLQPVTNNKFKIDVDKLWNNKKAALLDNILELENVLSESDREYLKKYIWALAFFK